MFFAYSVNYKMTYCQHLFHLHNFLDPDLACGRLVAIGIIRHKHFTACRQAAAILNYPYLPVRIIAYFMQYRIKCLLLISPIQMVKGSRINSGDRGQWKQLAITSNSIIKKAKKNHMPVQTQLIGIIAGICTGISLLPQLFKIIKEKDG